jgi:thiol:disulfide interchange protein DsbD
MGENRRRLGKTARVSVLGLWCFFAVLCAAAGTSAEIHNQHAKVDLVAAKDAVAPGETAWLGLHFVLEPGWHIYWQNPGDSGEPPSVRWTLPAGFHAGAIEWPAPQRLGSGSVIDFGYSGEVLLMIPLATPANAAPGTRENLGAAAKWLVCCEICVPDQAPLSLTMNIVARPLHAGRELPPGAALPLFERFRKLIPAAVPSNWKVTAISDGDDFILSVETGTAEEHAAFYPFLPDPIENSAPQTAARLPKGVQLRLHKSDQVVKPVTMLKGVLELGDPQGRSVAAYRVTVPVRQASKR